MSNGPDAVLSVCVAFLQSVRRCKRGPHGCSLRGIRDAGMRCREADRWLWRWSRNVVWRQILLSQMPNGVDEHPVLFDLKQQAVCGTTR